AWTDLGSDLRHRLKHDVEALVLGSFLPGGAQLYAEDCWLGAYLLGLAVAGVVLLNVGQPVVAAIFLVASWAAGLVLAPLSVRKFNDREVTREPDIDDVLGAQ
ncbi:MAG TPA: hypothetical protein VGB18_05695, partial [Candidatus Thermoplasmatota archaeon]